MKRIIAIIVMAVVCLTLSGCDFNLVSSVDSLEREISNGNTF